MSNLSKMTSQIISEAEEKKKKILLEADAEAKIILDNKEKDASILKAEIVQNAKIKAEIEKSRILASASLEVRNEKLIAKQNIIEDVLKRSLDTLASLDEIKYSSFLKESILKLDIVGDEKLILNEKTKKLLDDKSMKEINNSLVSKGKKGEISISHKNGDFKGGFILEKDGIILNYTFESIIESLKEELEMEIARELFN